MSHICGWAFTYQNSIEKQYKDRYKELMLEYKVNKYITIEKADGGRGFKKISGTVIDSSLSELDIAILLDRGNCCFGGECTICDGKFICIINTD
jgi:hypothetical protein